MVFASIVEYAAVSYIGHLRPSAAAAVPPSSRRRPNGTCGARLTQRHRTTTTVDGQLAPAAAADVR